MLPQGFYVGSSVRWHRAAHSRTIVLSTLPVTLLFGFVCRLQERAWTLPFSPIFGPTTLNCGVVLNRKPPPFPSPSIRGTDSWRRSLFDAVVPKPISPLRPCTDHPSSVHLFTQPLGSISIRTPIRLNGVLDTSLDELSYSSRVLLVSRANHSSPLPSSFLWIWLDQVPTVSQPNWLRRSANRRYVVSTLARP